MVEMRFSIISRRKKKGGHYYILMGVDDYGWKRIFGRFKSLARAKKRMRRLESRYGD